MVRTHKYVCERHVGIFQRIIYQKISLLTFVYLPLELVSSGVLYIWGLFNHWSGLLINDDSLYCFLNEM